MTSVVAPPLEGVLRASAPLQVEISAQFLVGIAGTILLMLLFLVVVVLWDIALALRDVAEKIDYLEDDVDSDLATINGTLTRIYDRMGSGSGASTQSDAGAGAQLGVQSTNKTGSAGGMPVGAGGPATATKTPRGGSVEGAQVAGANGAAAGAPAGSEATAYDGRRPVANPPTATNERTRTSDSFEGETEPGVEDGVVGGTEAADDSAPGEAGTAPGDATADGTAYEPASEASTASENSMASAGPTAGGGSTVAGGATQAGDSPTPQEANANVGRFASDGSGDEAWYDVTMDVPRTPSGRGLPGLDDADGDGADADEPNESGLRPGAGETTGTTAGERGGDETGPAMHEDGSAGTPRPDAGGRLDAGESGVAADEVMQSDAVRDAYVDPVSAFGDDEFGPDRSRADRRVSLADLQGDADEPGGDADDATDDDPIVDDAEAPAVDESDASPAVGEQDGIESLDGPGTAVVDEETVQSPAENDGSNGVGLVDVEDGADGDDPAVDAVESGADTATSAGSEDAGGEGAVRTLAVTKERIRERNADEDGELEYQSLQQEAAETEGVNGSGLPPEELLDALAAAAAHDETVTSAEGSAVMDAETGANDDATDESIENLFETGNEPADENVNAVEDALADRREETDEDDDAVDGTGPSEEGESGDENGIADLVNRELDTLTEEVGGTSMTPDVSGAELDTAVDELDDGSYTFPLSGSSFDVNAAAESETATLSFTPNEPVSLDGARERLLKYQLRNYLGRDDTAHAELSVDRGTVHLEIPAANGPAVDAWADAAVQIIDRTLYLSKDED